MGRSSHCSAIRRVESRMSVDANATWQPVRSHVSYLASRARANLNPYWSWVRVQLVVPHALS